MSMVQLVVREATRDWSGHVHGSCADRAIAALSADPTSLDELELAIERFAHRNDGRYFRNLRLGLSTEPFDAGFVLIDLVARLVVVDSTYSAPGHDGGVHYHNGDVCTDKVVSYHLADDWMFVRDVECWEGTAEARRRAHAARPPLDARAVFYGRPLLEFLARSCFERIDARDEIAARARADRIEKKRTWQARREKCEPAAVDMSRLTDAEVNPQSAPGEANYMGLFYDTLRQIHADWLLTPREDLYGACPREVAQARREHLTWDLQDREFQWSRMGRCPRGIPESSYAYGYAGFGTHELIMYYELIRELLYATWGRLLELTLANPQKRIAQIMSVGDFLTAEIPQLEADRDAWLNSPHEEFRERTPQSIIDRERARLPEGMSGQECMIDCDCPLCQMNADLPGPMFWHFDGCNMDDDFAFSLHCRTREEWDAEQREQAEFNESYKRTEEERIRLGVDYVSMRSDDPDSEWSRKLTVDDSPDVPLGIRIFQIGADLAEVIARLKRDTPADEATPETRHHIDQLNRDFGNLRAVLIGPERSLSQALLSPVIDRFIESLDAVELSRSDLSNRCEPVRGRLRNLLDSAEESFLDDREYPDMPF